MNQIITTSNDVDDMTLNSQFLQDEGVGVEDLASIGSIMADGKSLMQNAMIELEDLKKQNIILTDSITNFEDDIERGKRYFLNYNSDTGLFRYYDVKYDKFFHGNGKPMTQQRSFLT